MYQLMNLEIPLKRETIDKIGNTFYLSLTHVPIDECRHSS